MHIAKPKQNQRCGEKKKKHHSCVRHLFQCIFLLDMDWWSALLGSSEELLKASKETLTSEHKILKASLLVEGGEM